MIAARRTSITPIKEDRAPTWAEAWHLWTVFMPRRTITGRLVRGMVWRRHNGRRWIYKKFVEFNCEEPR